MIYTVRFNSDFGRFTVRWRNAERQYRRPPATNDAADSTLEAAPRFGASPAASDKPPLPKPVISVGADP